MKKREPTQCKFCQGKIIFLQDDKGYPVAVEAKSVKPGDVGFVAATGHILHQAVCEDLREYLKEREV